jgi:hypothetical protein
MLPKERYVGNQPNPQILPIMVQITGKNRKQNRLPERAIAKVGKPSKMHTLEKQHFNEITSVFFAPAAKTEVSKKFGKFGNQREYPKSPDDRSDAAQPMMAPLECRRCG